MSVIEVWLTDQQLEYLKKLKEIYEELEDKVFNGKSYGMGFSGGRRHKIRRKRITYSFIIREAINSLMDETKKKHADGSEHLEHEEPEENKQPWKTDSRLNSWGITVDRRRREWRAPTDHRLARLARKY
jgi:hypothetical protein